MDNTETSTVVSVESINDVEAAVIEAIDNINTQSAVQPQQPETTTNNETIPENSKSAYIEETTSRFSGATWFNKIQEKVITLAGIGGIGSYCAFLLARMHPKALFLYDRDIVEEGNMSGQLYCMSDIGNRKVDAMYNMIKNYSNYSSIFSMPTVFDITSEASDIMMCGFDNMNARKIYYIKWLEHVKQKSPEERKNCLFIDGRLAAESIQVFCLTGDDKYNQDIYKDKWLFSSYSADETRCSYKQTTFCANMIGSIMVNLFVNFCANQCNPLTPRDLPFFTSYEAETMYFKTEN